MAWTSPRTWADGEVPTATQFNQEFRDNFNELALHKHDGGSGSGASTLGGTVGLNHVSFANGAAPGAPTGGFIRVFGSNDTLGWVNSASAVRYAANSTHEHTGSWVQPTATGSGTTFDVLHSSGGTATGWSIFTPQSALPTNTFVTVATATMTLGGNGSRAVFVYAGFILYSQTAAARPVQLRGEYSTDTGSSWTQFDGGVNPIRHTLSTIGAYHYHAAGTFTGQTGTILFRAQVNATNTGVGNQPVPVHSTIVFTEFQIK